MDAVETRRHRERPRSGSTGGPVVRSGHVQLQPGVQDGPGAGDDRRGVHRSEPVAQLALHRGGGMGRNSHSNRLPRVSGSSLNPAALSQCRTVTESPVLCVV